MGSIALQLRCTFLQQKEKSRSPYPECRNCFSLLQVAKLHRGILLHLNCNKADINSPNKWAVLKKKKDNLEGFLVCQTN